MAAESGKRKVGQRDCNVAHKRQMDYFFTLPARTLIMNYSKLIKTSGMDSGLNLKWLLFLQE